MVEITFGFTKAERLEGEVEDLLNQVDALGPTTEIHIFHDMLLLSYNLAAKLAELRAEDAEKAKAIESRVWRAPYKLRKVMEECWSLLYNAGFNSGKKKAEE